MQQAIGGRDARIDFWRGLALLTIFVNHMPGNAFERLTHKNFGFSDAAEAFVLLAGFSAALAYFHAFKIGHCARQVVAVLLRVSTLYVAHIVTLMGAAALTLVAAGLLADPRLLEYSNVAALLRNPADAIVGIVLLGHHLAYFDILPLYVMLLLLLPGLMGLARIHLGLALAVSMALYLASQLLSLNLPRFPGEGGWHFNPFAWQFLFAVGFVAGALTRAGTPIPYHRTAFVGACCFLAASLGWILARVALDPDALPLPRFLWGFDKQNLSLPRIAHVLALAYVLAHLPFGRWLPTTRSGGLLTLLGRQALPVFCLGSLLSALGQIFRVALGGGWPLDWLLISAGVAVQLALAWVLEWHKTAPRPSAAVPPAPGRAALAASWQSLPSSR